MRKGLLWTLAFWLTAGVAHAQGPYLAYPGYAGYGPMPGYSPPGMVPYPPTFAPSGLVPYPQPYAASPVPAMVPYARPIPCESCQRTNVAQSGPASEPMMTPPCIPGSPSTPNPDTGISTTTYTTPGGDLSQSCGSFPPVCPVGYRWYGKGEVLYWFTSNQSIPGQSDLGSAGSSIAVPGYNNISINSIFPGYSNLLAFSHLGGRASLGRWLDDSSSIGLEGTIFGVYTAVRPYYASGGPTTVPSASAVSNVASTLGLSEDQATAFLNNLSGKNLVANLSVLGGAEANLRFEIGESITTRLDFLLGFRWLYLNDYMGVINQQGAVLINTQNSFWGGQIGLEGEFVSGRWFLDGWAKLALGSNHQTASIGSSAAAAGNFVSTLGNGGVSDRDVFTTVPEIGVSLGCRIGYHTRVFANYSIVYMNNTARPASQIGNYLNGSVPAWNFTDTYFWAQGVSVGLEFRF